MIKHNTIDIQSIFILSQSFELLNSFSQGSPFYLLTYSNTQKCFALNKIALFNEMNLLVLDFVKILQKE